MLIVLLMSSSITDIFLSILLPEAKELYPSFREKFYQVFQSSGRTNNGFSHFSTDIIRAQNFDKSRCRTSRFHSLCLLPLI